jgi:hypothetical protein
MTRDEQRRPLNPLLLFAIAWACIASVGIAAGWIAWFAATH